MGGAKLDISHPVTYNEKLQYLKLYDRNPVYTMMVDKYQVKKYVADIIGEKYIIPTLGCWKSFDEISFNNLPNQFVLKCTHDSGGLYICKDKSHMNYSEAKSKINSSLKRNYYFQGREWPYKNVPHLIIAEKYMEDKNDLELRDYKFLCFSGEPKLMFIASNRQRSKEPYFDFFDMDFNFLNLRHGHPNSPEIPHKPVNFELMKELASMLSKGVPHVRVDFYEVNGSVYFGELTLFHHGGFVPFDPPTWDYKLGELIKLPK